jgi:hypothetical protein
MCLCGTKNYYPLSYRLILTQGFRVVVLKARSSARQEANFRLFYIARLNELCLRSSFDYPKGHRHYKAYRNGFLA